MDLGKLKEPFPQDRISWRAQTVSKDGTKALALAYIDARDVMERLDEICGPANWACRYSHAGQKTVCDIGIAVLHLHSQTVEWVWKADGAGDSDIEAEKGALSDAFKRAAVRWGIGRYLYDLDSPWVPCESRESNGKKQFVKFTDDPWKHVRHGPKGTSPPKVDKAAPGQTNTATLTPGQKATAWVESARRTIEGIQAPEAYMEWKNINDAALAKLEANYPDKYEALQVFIDGKRGSWAEKF
jgi:hypothetical protein